MVRITTVLTAVMCGVGLAGCGVATEDDVGATQSQITYGQLDGDAHPGVVLLLAEVKGAPAWRCSATLLSPTVVLTAGHCTYGTSGGRIFLESDVQNGDNNYPFAGPNSVEIAEMHTHPGYTESAFFVHDVGVAILAEPVALPASAYGQLPGLDQLDALKPRKSTTFTPVGYGLQRINPVFVVAEKVRMSASPSLVAINVPGFTGSFSMLLSNNASSGGTCFGDSGGPNFLGTSNVVAGVTSFGINGNCAGTGGVFRMDRADVLAFVQQFL